MESYRNPKYIERLEDVIFELETPLNTTVANTRSQKKDGYRFVVDNSGEVTPLDWFNARIGVSFKVNKLADGANIAAEDHNGIVNSIHSLIKNFDIKLNGKKVYDCNDANHSVNIKIFSNTVLHMLHRLEQMNFIIWIQVEQLKNAQLRLLIIIKGLLHENCF